MAPTLTDFQGLNMFIQYFDTHPHKPNFHPYNSCEGSNVVRPTWSGEQVEDYPTQNGIECHHDEYYERILNKGRLVSGIIHTLTGVAV